MRNSKTYFELVASTIRACLCLWQLQCEDAAGQWVSASSFVSPSCSHVLAPSQLPGSYTGRELVGSRSVNCLGGPRGPGAETLLQVLPADGSQKPHPPTCQGTASPSPAGPAQRLSSPAPPAAAAARSEPGPVGGDAYMDRVWAGTAITLRRNPSSTKRYYDGNQDHIYIPTKTPFWIWISLMIINAD